MHILLLKCPHVQILFLKFTSCDNQVLVGCIPVATVAVHLNLKSKIGQSSYKMYRNYIQNFRVYDNLKCLYKNVWKLLNAPRIYIYIYIYPIPPYRPLLLAGPQGYTPYLHRDAVCRFVLVDLSLLNHV